MACSNCSWAGGFLSSEKILKYSQFQRQFVDDFQVTQYEKDQREKQDGSDSDMEPASFCGRHVIRRRGLILLIFHKYRQEKSVAIQ